jgi:hypothetical protein
MDASETLLLLTKHLLLTGLPLSAAILLAARCGVRQLPVLLAIGLAASGLIGVLGFWSYFADPLVGESFAYLILFGSVLLLAWSLYGDHLDRALLRRLGTPLTLWALGSAFLLFLGFLHGGADASIPTSMTRFSHPLPGDSELPLFFTEWFSQHGHHGMPPKSPGGWLASDRPPLQTGYALSQLPFGWDGKGLDYQVLGIVLQQLWIVGLWALLVAAKVGRVTRALAVVAALVSDLAILNGFFVWPKLLPAAMLLAVAALVMTPLWEQLRRNLWAAALIATLCGVAMLGHGASVFGIVPLALVATFRGLPSWRWLGVALAVGIALMASWSAYQKYGDPPGNRLTKWTLAGVIEVDDRGSAEAIFDAYGEVGLGGAVDNKIANFETMIGGVPVLDSVENALDSGNLTEMVRTLREVNFYYLLPSMGLLLLVPLAMAAGWRRRDSNPAEWDFAIRCFVVFVIGAATWGLLVFGNELDRTLLHICTYLLPLLGIAGAVVGLRAVFPRFALGFVGASSLFNLALYVPSLEPPAGSSYLVSAGILAAAALAGFGFVALRGDRYPEGSAQAG